MKKFVLTYSFSLCCLFCFATNYTSTGDGDYSDAIWDVQAPDPIPVGDTVFINHEITLDAELNVKGVLVISASGRVIGDKKLKNDDVAGAIFNYGEINITQEIHIDGYWENNSYSYGKKVHNDGIVCNNDTIEIDPTQKWDQHGGIVQCGGVIKSCNFKFHDGNLGSPTLGSSQLDTCSLGCGGNTIEVNDPITVPDPDSVYYCNISLSGVGLPITLNHFTAISMNEVVILEWETISEINNDYFIIEKSLNGKDWLRMTMKDGAGTSISMLSYQYADYNPAMGTSYYRLSQVDFDGSMTTFEPIEVNYQTKRDQLEIFPNPASEFIIVNIYLTSSDELAIYNSKGQEINVPISSYYSNSRIETGSLNNGLYILQHKNAKGTESIKFYVAH